MNDKMISADGKYFTPPPMTEEQMQTRAHRDAMAAIARDIPNPKKFARYMPLNFVEMLLRARHCTIGGSNPDGGLCVEPHEAEALRPYGLVAAGTGPHGRFLTAFGLAVRRALVAEDA